MDIRNEHKERTWWITCLLFLYFIYYLSYDSTLLNTNIILIASLGVLLIEIGRRVIENNGKASIELLIVFMSSIWAFVCSFLNGSGFGSAVTQTTLLMAVCLFSSTQLTRSQHNKVMFRMVLVLLLVLIIFSEPSLYRSYFSPILPYFPNTVHINPNCIAMLTFYLFVFLFEFIENASFKKRYKKLLQFIVLAAALFYIYLSSARTSMFAALVFIALFWLCKYKKANITRTAFFIVLCLSFVIVFIYTALYSSGYMIDEIVGGKNFYTGRESIWIEALQLVSKNPIIGFSNKIAFGPKEIYSVHNSLLAILCYFGIFGLVSTVAVLYISFKKIDYKNNPLIVSALFSTTIIMCFETSITDWSLLLPFCLLFLQTKCKPANE